MEPVETARHVPRLGWRTIALAVLIGLALAFLFRFQSFTFEVGPDPDEGVAALLGRAILQGDLPYTRYFDHRQPLLYFNFAMAESLFGQRMLSLRIWAALNVGLAGAFASLIVFRLTSNRIGALLTSILVCMCSSAAPSIQAVSEIFALPWSTLAVLCAVVAGTGSVRGWRYLSLLAGAGFSLGCATQVKLFWAAELPVIVFAAFFLRGFPRPSELRPMLIGTAWLACFALLPLAFFLALYSATGHLDQFIYANFTYNRAYGAKADIYLSTLRNYLKQSVLNYSATLVPIALSLWSWKRDPWSRLLMIGWLFVAFIASASPKRFYMHYAVLMIPSLCCFAGLCAPVLAQMDARRRRIALLAIALGVMPFAYNLSTNPLTINHRNVANLQAISQRYSKPGDVVHFVNIETAYYFISKTEPPTYWIFPEWIGNHLWTDVSKLDWKSEIDAIIDKQPAFICFQIDVQRWDVEPITYYLEKLEGRYRHAESVGAFEVFVPVDPK